MCFMPALATATGPTLTPFPAPGGAITLFALRHYKPANLAGKFTLPHHAEIGLVIGCGCWLRHLDISPSSARQEDIVQDPKYNPSTEQPNHDALVDYLQAHFRQDGFVEFYGCNAHEVAEPEKERLELAVEAVRHPHFHFRVGTVYRFTFGPKRLYDAARSVGERQPALIGPESKPENRRGWASV